MKSEVGSPKSEDIETYLTNERTTDCEGETD